MNSPVQDVKQAVRLLTSNRGFAAVALLTIARGVGGTTAVFSVVYGVLLRSLPYPEPERLVRMWEVHPGANAPFGDALLSHPTYGAWSRESRTLQEIGGFRVSDYTVTGFDAVQRLRGTRVTPSLFRVLRVSPAIGRLFTEADAQPHSATSRIQPLLINGAFVRRYFTDGRPATGRRFTGMFPRMLGRNDAVFEVVGVVNDVLPGPDARPQPQIYVTHGGGFDMGRPALVVKTEGDPAAMVSVVRGIVRQLEPGAALDRLGPLEDKLSSSVGKPRLAAFVLVTFSVIALVLAATGLYGVLSYSVARRRAEIGMRAALGATKSDLMRMVLREGLTAT